MSTNEDWKAVDCFLLVTSTKACIPFLCNPVPNRPTVLAVGLLQHMRSPGDAVISHIVGPLPHRNEFRHKELHPCFSDATGLFAS